MLLSIFLLYTPEKKDLMKTLIIFDIDGTLLNTVDAHQSALLQTLESFSFPLINKNWGSYKHHTDSWILHELFLQNFNRYALPAEFQKFDILLHQFYVSNLLKYKISPIAGANDFLEIIYNNQKKYAFAFATGAMRLVACEKLNFLNKKIDQIILSSASEYLTREEIVLNAIERSKQKFGDTKFRRVISIGDGVWDAKVAANLKLEFIGIGEWNEKFEGLCKPNQFYKGFNDIDSEQL